MGNARTIQKHSIHQFNTISGNIKCLLILYNCLKKFIISDTTLSRRHRWLVLQYSKLRTLMRVDAKRKYRRNYYATRAIFLGKCEERNDIMFYVQRTARITRINIVFIQINISDVMTLCVLDTGFCWRQFSVYLHKIMIYLPFYPV